MRSKRYLGAVQQGRKLGRGVEVVWWIHVMTRRASISKSMFKVMIIHLKTWLKWMQLWSCIFEYLCCSWKNLRKVVGLGFCTDPVIGLWVIPRVWTGTLLHIASSLWAGAMCHCTFEGNFTRRGEVVSPEGLDCSPNWKLMERGSQRGLRGATSWFSWHSVSDRLGGPTASKFSLFCLADCCPYSH